jgi:tRNA(Ile)-lysidine synthase
VGTLIEQIEENIGKHALLRDGEKILVAVSGGLDSMVLLELLKKLSAKHRWKLAIAHFNHKLRNRSGDADENFVQRIAKKYALKFISENADVRKFAKGSGLSIEMAGRKLRHDFFARTATELQISTVALAHHANDQLETFFIRLLRGAGSEGLAGMKWKSKSPSSCKVELIRPLLDQPKASLRNFATQNKINFREDATNAALNFQRNRIRHELLPLLRQHQPGLDKTVLRVMEILGADAEFVTHAAEEWLAGAGKKDFTALSVAVQRRALQTELLLRGLSPDFELIESLRKEADKMISVAPGLSIFRDASGKINLKQKIETEFPSSQKIVRLSRRTGKVTFDRVEICWALIPKREFKPKAQFQREFFDADLVSSKIILRHWQPGDRFQPTGMSRAVKLQDLFTNAKISRTERHELILATTVDGEIFWVEKLRIGERFKLRPYTLRQLSWSWQRH